MPLTGTPPPTPATPSAVSPKRPLEGNTSGSNVSGTPNRAQSSGDQRWDLMSNSSVRLALETSVAWTAPASARPPVRFHNNHESMVPKASPSRTATPPSVNSHSSLDAEK